MSLSERNASLSLLAKAQNKIWDSREQTLLVKHQAALGKMLLLLENRDRKRQLLQRLMHKSINKYIQPDSFIPNNGSFYTSPKVVLPTSCFVFITTSKSFIYAKYQLVPSTGTKVSGCNLNHLFCIPLKSCKLKTGLAKVEVIVEFIADVSILHKGIPHII